MIAMANHLFFPPCPSLTCWVKAGWGEAGCLLLPPPNCPSALSSSGLSCFGGESPGVVANPKSSSGPAILQATSAVGRQKRMMRTKSWEGGGTTQGSPTFFCPEKPMWGAGLAQNPLKHAGQQWGSGENQPPPHPAGETQKSRKGQQASFPPTHLLTHPCSTPQKI